MTYNGYVNYETWNVALWLNNEEGSYNYWTERAQELLNEHEGDKEKADYDLAQELENEIKDNHPLIDAASMFSDLLGHALGMVEWRDIAENFTEDLEYTE